MKGKRKRKVNPLQKKAFMAARKAALDAGWEPFTKMTPKQKKAFKEAFDRIYRK